MTCILYSTENGGGLPLPVYQILPAGSKSASAVLANKGINKIYCVTAFDMLASQAKIVPAYDIRAVICGKDTAVPGHAGHVHNCKIVPAIGKRIEIYFFIQTQSDQAPGKVVLLEQTPPGFLIVLSVQLSQVRMAYRMRLYINALAVQHPGLFPGQVSARLYRHDVRVNKQGHRIPEFPHQRKQL